MRIKNKTLFLLLAGFVFLILVAKLHFGADQKLTADEAVSANLAQAELSQQEIYATSSSETEHPVYITHPVAAAAPPLSHASLRFAGQARGDLNYEYFQVVKVVDGDTIDIIMNGKTERLRLIGINTPEVVDPRKPVECFGREASDNAKKLLAGQEVRIAADPSQDDRDKYGRLLRYVWRQDGLFYNLAAIKDGFAYEYTYDLPYIYQKEFKEAQKYAQENKLGLWADGACGLKNIGSGNVAATSSTGEKCLIKGNISSTGPASAKASADKEKIYHVPGCDYYNQTVISEDKGERWFCSEAEAIAAGWRKAKNCP
ncbi:MAG: thermonuclease family protein [Patescibacteria group bacterium]|nr:thermonuclease family protein [Patescibacteria group bacterium]